MKQEAHDRAYRWLFRHLFQASENPEHVVGVPDLATEDEYNEWVRRGEEPETGYLVWSEVDKRKILERMIRLFLEDPFIQKCLDNDIEKSDFRNRVIDRFNDRSFRLLEKAIEGFDVKRTF